MSFEQLPENIPPAESGSEDSQVTEAEIASALKDIRETPDEVDTTTTNQFSGQSEVTYVEPEDGLENQVITEFPETGSFNQPTAKELPRESEREKVRESPAPQEREQEDTAADEEVEQAEKRAREADEVERVRAELQELGENKLEFSDRDGEPPLQKGGDGGGGGGGGGWRRESSGVSLTREDTVHYKVCENCGGTGRIFFFLKCRKCRGSGEIKTGRSTGMRAVQES